MQPIHDFRERASKLSDYNSHHHKDSTSGKEGESKDSSEVRRCNRGKKSRAWPRGSIYKGVEVKEVLRVNCASHQEAVLVEEKVLLWAGQRALEAGGVRGFLGSPFLGQGGRGV